MCNFWAHLHKTHTFFAATYKGKSVNILPFRYCYVLLNPHSLCYLYHPKIPNCKANLTIAQYEIKSFFKLFFLGGFQNNHPLLSPSTDDSPWLTEKSKQVWTQWIFSWEILRKSKVCRLDWQVKKKKCDRGRQWQTISVCLPRNLQVCVATRSWDWLKSVFTFMLFTLIR